MRVHGGALVGDDAAALIEGGVALVITTADEDLRPDIARAWGPVVSEDRRSITLCAAVAGIPRVRSGLAAGAEVALSFTQPTTYRAIQVKGRVVDVHDPTAEQLQRVDRHLEDFCREAIAVGVAPRVAERFLMGPEFLGVTVAVRELYDQTPGPSAGAAW